MKEAADYEQRLSSVILELEDIADEAERMAERVEYNPARVDVINERLNVMYDLLHKHRLEKVEELIALKEELGKKLKGIQSFAEQIEILEKQIKSVETEMDSLAGKLHKARVASEEKLREEMRGLLVSMGIKHAVFKVMITPLDHFTTTGKDDVSFLFSANKNQEPGELVKVASGGEISRLMLSLKYLFLMKLIQGSAAERREGSARKCAFWAENDSFSALRICPRLPRREITTLRYIKKTIRWEQFPVSFV